MNRLLDPDQMEEVSSELEMKAFLMEILASHFEDNQEIFLSTTPIDNIKPVCIFIYSRKSWKELLGNFSFTDCRSIFNVPASECSSEL